MTTIPTLGRHYAFDRRRLAALMAERGLSRSVLGAIIGRTHEIVRRYEEGLNDPPIPVLGDLALALRVRPEELLVLRPGRPKVERKRGRKLKGATLRERAALASA